MTQNIKTPISKPDEELGWITRNKQPGRNLELTRHTLFSYFLLYVVAWAHVRTHPYTQ